MQAGRRLAWDLDERVYSHCVARDSAYAILLRIYFTYLFAREKRLTVFPPGFFFFFLSFRFNCKRFVAF